MILLLQGYGPFLSLTVSMFNKIGQVELIFTMGNDGRIFTEFAWRRREFN